MGNYDIQPANPGSAEKIADLIYATDPSVWDYLFDNNRELYARYISALWEQKNNTFAHTEAHVLVSSSGQLQGVELGYTGANEPQMRQNTYPVIQASLSSGERLVLINNARHIEYLTPFTPSRGYYLHFLSLAPECKGKGFGRVFMEHVFERAGSKGCTSVHLDVYKTNPATQFYQSFGFEVVVELHFPNKPGLPPHYRMAKSL